MTIDSEALRRDYVEVLAMPLENVIAELAAYQYATGRLVTAFPPPDGEPEAVAAFHDNWSGAAEMIINGDL